MDDPEDHGNGACRGGKEEFVSPIILSPICQAADPSRGRAVPCRDSLLYLSEHPARADTFRGADREDCAAERRSASWRCCQGAEDNARAFRSRKTGPANT